MSLFHSLRSALRNVFAPAAVFCLLTLFVFTGCQVEADDPYIDDHELKQGLIGTWESEYGDFYTITKNSLAYDNGYGGDWSGRIVYVSNFSNSAGVIIIEYNTNSKQQWTDWFSENYDDITPDGNFYGIYFRDLKQNTVDLANTSDQNNNLGPSETVTEWEAIKRFTLEKRADWMDPGYPNVLTRKAE